MLTYEEVSELLEYRPEVGGSCLVWKVDRKNNKTKGLRAGSPVATGHWNVSINRKLYKAHRLVWLLVTKAWPEKDLDHADRNPGNNAISNLRECTHQENHQNRKKPCNNTSGYVGVYWYKPLKKWKAQISDNGQRVHLGYYESITDAAEAYTEAKRTRHLFHPNSGV